MTDKTKLQAALEAAARGFKVIRLAEDRRDPPIDVMYFNVATADPERIRKLWTCGVTGWEQFYNPAILCDYLCAVDVDMKGGNDGLATLAEHGIELPRTYTQLSASGGLHYVYTVSKPVANRQCRKDLKGVDIRGWHGYVLAAGATVDGRPYGVLDDIEPQPLPPELYHALGLRDADTTAPIDWSQKGPDVAKDDPKDIARTIEYLINDAPETLGDEGTGRNPIVFKVVQAVRDFGVSLTRGRALLWEYYRDRCSFTDEEFDKTIRNAYRYSSEQQGSASVASDFDDVTSDEPATPAAESEDDVLATGFRVWQAPADPRTMPIMRWLIPGFLAPGHASLLFAPGGSGKSMLGLSIALAVAMGDGSHIGMEVNEPGIVYVFSGEDDDDIVNRRLWAAIQYHGIDPARVGDRLRIKAGRVANQEAKLLLRNKHGNLVPTDFAKKLGASLRSSCAALTIFDPVVKFHAAEENSNTEMNLLGDLMCGIAQQGDTAMLAMHHTSKPEGVSSEGFAGNINKARGATALKDAFRVGKSFFAASPQDGKRFGIPELERDRYVRLDDAKINHARATRRAKWYYFENVRIPNGEDVGALRPIGATEFTDRDRLLYAKLLIRILEQHPEGIAVKTAAEIIGEDQIFVDETTKHIANRIGELFAEPQTVEDWSIWINTDEKGKKAKTLHGHALTPSQQE